MKQTKHNRGARLVKVILDGILTDIIGSEALDRQIGAVAVQNLAILLPVVCVGAEGGLESNQVAEEDSLLGAELRAQKEVSLLGDGVSNVLRKSGLESR